MVKKFNFKMEFFQTKTFKFFHTSITDSVFKNKRPSSLGATCSFTLNTPKYNFNISDKGFGAKIKNDVSLHVIQNPKMRLVNFGLYFPNNIKVKLLSPSGFYVSKKNPANKNQLIVSQSMVALNSSLNLHHEKNISAQVTLSFPYPYSFMIQVKGPNILLGSSIENTRNITLSSIFLKYQLFPCTLDLFYCTNQELYLNSIAFSKLTCKLPGLVASFGIYINNFSETLQTMKEVKVKTVISRCQFKLKSNFYQSRTVGLGFFKINGNKTSNLRYIEFGYSNEKDIQLHTSYRFNNKDMTKIHAGYNIDQKYPTIRIDFTRS